MPEASFSLASPLSRRTFLGSAGLLTATATLLTACKDEPVVPVSSTPALDLGESNAGIVSYLFLLKRLATGFYQAALATPAPDLTATDLAVLRDINRHEIIHREALIQVFQLNGLVADATLTYLTTVEFVYSTFTLTTRQGVLAGAQRIEDLTVAAFAGMAKLISSPLYFTVLMKMMAVDSRHAAAVRDLVQPGSFAGSDVVSSTGIDAGQNQLLTPAAGLTELNKYTNNLILTGSKLPTS